MEKKLQLLNKTELSHLVNSHKVDVAFVSFYVLYSLYFYFQVSLISVPIGDAADYLSNARSWLFNTPLTSSFRPPLISWITAGIWGLVGENWIVIKYLMPAFTLTAGIIFYVFLKKYKGSLFAFGVCSLTMLNPQVFFWGTQILTESLSLLFVILTLYFVKSDKKISWFLAGVTIALTFASRYPIILQSLAIFIVEFILRKNYKLASYAVMGALPIITIVVLVVLLKTGTFIVATAQDTQFTFFLSPFYLQNSINIWGIAFLLVPLAFIFRKTYSDTFNYVFIVWFFVSLIFWSSNATNHQSRFALQFTPAVYFLAILAVENIGKINIPGDNFSLEKIVNKFPFRHKRVIDIVVLTDIEEVRRLIASGWEYQTSYPATIANVPHYVLVKKE